MKECRTKECKKSAYKGRNYCGGCAKNKWIKKNPINYIYQNLKGNAKRRGKVFTITLEEFKEFIIPTEYLVGRGILKHSLHIDRIREEEGYVKGNLQILQNTDNLKKYLDWKWDEETSQMKYEVKTTKVINTLENDLPF